MKNMTKRPKSIYWTCGLIGLLLGGPISGVLSSLCIYLILKGANGEGNGGSNASRSAIFLSLLGWATIGSVAMPISWFAANSIGWNFDAVALIQSSGRYKSYRDWSHAEKDEEKREREWRKVQSRLKQEERNRELEERKVQQKKQDEIMGSELESIATDFIRIDPYGKEWDDSACEASAMLLQRLDALRERYGWSFAMWKHDATASASTAYWEGQVINALELRESIKDVIKTCGAIQSIP